ncbi:hypothetical protein R84981_002544 [Carnimonas sp. R-84981]|uniref:hypothetical protein n=1 Tax=Carnimonas bestiolae TaxID=3402172 RepID=UPI003EDC3660
MKESSNNDSNAPSYSTLRAAVGLFFVAVLVIFALLMLLGVIIESTEHNGAGYAVALFSLVIAVLAALGLSRCYRDVAALLGKSHWLSAAKRSGATTRSKGRRRSRSGKAQQTRREPRSPAQVKAARQEPEVQAPPRERYVTSKGEEPFVGGLAGAAGENNGSASGANAQRAAQSANSAPIEPLLGTDAAEFDRDGAALERDAAASDRDDAFDHDHTAARYEAPTASISAIPRDEPVPATDAESDVQHHTAAQVHADEALREEENEDWVQRIDEQDASALRHAEKPNDSVADQGPSTPTAAREKPRVRVVAGGKVDT